MKEALRGRRPSSNLHTRKSARRSGRFLHVNITFNISEMRLDEWSRKAYNSVCCAGFM